MVDPISPELIPAGNKRLTAQDIDGLWKIFLEIGDFWKIENVPRFKGAWLEFVKAKTDYEPSYVGEYKNALEVLKKEETSLLKLVAGDGVPNGEPRTRLAHAKRFVVDEFIRVLITSGGFKSFVTLEDRPSANYRGYVGGSRYNRLPRVRIAAPDKEGGQSEDS